VSCPETKTRELIALADEARWRKPSVAPERTPLVLSWSGGKDSALALYELERDPHFEVVAIMTSLADEFRRISHHGVREELLDAQADALGLPLIKIYLPSGKNTPCTNEVYEEIMGRAMDELKSQGVYTVGFGDLFLEDLRAWREQNLAKAGMSGVFPIWKRDTRTLSRRIVAMGFKAVLSCVEGKVGPGFAGRAYDDCLLDELPEGTDPCGEYGEFHTFVYDGPGFVRPVAIGLGEIVIRDGRYYADLLPAQRAVAKNCVANGIPPV
jgi:uncharacterized protein (TIGR00290 family)